MGTSFLSSVFGFYMFSGITHEVLIFFLSFIGLLKYRFKSYFCATNSSYD